MAEADQVGTEQTSSTKAQKPRSRRKLFIHIGSPKTGTTTLQKFLYDQRGALAREGVLYPEGGIKRSAHHILGAAVFPGRGSRLDAGVTREDALDSSVKAIRAQVDEQNPHTVILSTEYLWGYLSPANVRKLLAPFRDFEIHVVLYVRRQDLLAQSLYVQAVKGGEARTFNEWLDQARSGAKGGFHFDQVISAWRDSGIRTKIIVRVYERGQLASDIRQDFLDTVAPGVSVSLPDDRAANISPDVTTIELLRAISRILPDPEIANAIRRRLIGKSPPRTLFEPLSYFAPGEAEAFVAGYAEGNAAVAREVLGREDGVLFKDPVPTDDDEGRAWPDDAAVLARLIALLPQLMTQQAPPPKKRKE